MLVKRHILQGYSRGFFKITWAFASLHFITLQNTHTNTHTHTLKYKHVFAPFRKTHTHCWDAEVMGKVESTQQNIRVVVMDNHEVVVMTITTGVPFSCAIFNIKGTKIML